MSDLDGLRRMSEEGRRRQREEQVRNEQARILWEQETKRRQAQQEEAVFEAQARDVHEKAAAAAARGENHVILATCSGSDLGFQGGYFHYFFGPPKSVSPNRLGDRYHRLYDYCQQAGFRTTVELHKDDDRLRNGDLPSSWYYHLVIRW